MHYGSISNGSSVGVCPIVGEALGYDYVAMNIFCNMYDPVIVVACWTCSSVEFYNYILPTTIEQNLPEFLQTASLNHFSVNFRKNLRKDFRYFAMGGLGPPSSGGT